MAVRDLIAKALGLQAAPAPQTDKARLAAAVGLWDGASTQRLDGERLADYYYRRGARIREWVKARAAETFGAETTDWQFPPINGVPRAIHQLATSYTTPPQRLYHRGGKAVPKGVLEAIKTMYGGMDLDRKMRQVDRLTALYNTVLVEVVMRHGAIEFDVHTPARTAVEPELADYLLPGRVVVGLWPEPVGASARTQTLQPTAFLVWSPTEHYLIDRAGRLQPVMGGADGGNPYAEEAAQLREAAVPFPVVTVRREEADDFWGRYGADLVDGFEHVAVQLANAWHNLFMQGHGQPVAINLGLAGKPGAAGGKFLTGPNHPIAVDGVTKDEVQPNLTFAKPDLQIDKVQGFLDWYIRENGSTFGQPPSAWSMDSKAESGFAKLVDNLELMEARDQALAGYEKAERQLFEWARVVWNKYGPGPKVPMDVELDVLFSAVEFPESPQEEAQAWTSRSALGLASPVDYLMRKHKLQSREAAMELAKTIKAENAELLAPAAAPERPAPGTKPEPDKDTEPGGAEE
jgi:hypothetical protein